MRVAIDIDDVLFPWSDYAHAACEAAGITNGQRITRWEFWLDYGCTSEELWAVIDAAYETGGMLAQEPYPGTVEQLARLRELGHSVHLITARGFEGKLAGLVRAETAAWVHSYGIPHDTLTFAKDKGCIRADVGLDDAPRNCDAMAAAGIDAWLMTTHHNREQHVEFPRVSSLELFVDAIELGIAPKPSDGGGRVAEHVLGRLIELLNAERDAIGEAANGWHQGARAGLATAINLIEEAHA